MKQQTKKKQTAIKARILSILLTCVILGMIVYFFWQPEGSHLPNLHGWQSTDVLDFARRHDIDLDIAFSYSQDMAPTLVISQSLPPGEAITEGMTLVVEISKGVEVR